MQPRNGIYYIHCHITLRDLPWAFHLPASRTQFQTYVFSSYTVIHTGRLTSQYSLILEIYLDIWFLQGICRLIITSNYLCYFTSLKDTWKRFLSGKKTHEQNQPTKQKKNRNNPQTPKQTNKPWTIKTKPKQTQNKTK